MKIIYRVDDFVMCNVPNETWGGTKMNYLLTSTITSQMMPCIMENFAVKIYFETHALDQKSASQLLSLLFAFWNDILPFISVQKLRNPHPSDGAIKRPRHE